MINGTLVQLAVQQASIHGGWGRAGAGSVPGWVRLKLPDIWELAAIR
jgi:hypothetical protein